MADAFAYHVVTDRPVHIGQRIVFDEAHRSGVWQRVYARAEEVARLYADSNVAVAQELDHHLSVAFRELALEEVRSEHFPEYPSRLNCLYVSNTLEEAKSWCASFIRWGRPTYHIVRLKFDGPRFSGNARNCFVGTTNRNENMRLAKRYWRNLPHPEDGEPIIEVLIGGTIEVVEIIREVNANLK